MMPETGVTIHLVDVYAEQVKMGAQLAVLSKQLEQVPDHETRIRGLEQFRWKIAGISATCGVAAGFVSYLLGHLQLH